MTGPTTHIVATYTNSLLTSKELMLGNMIAPCIPACSLAREQIREEIHAIYCECVDVPSVLSLYSVPNSLN